MLSEPMRLRAYPLVLAGVFLTTAAPAYAGPPFLSDDPDPTPNGQYEIYLFANGATSDHDLEGDAGIDFNYGATPDLQLTATVPISYARPDGDDLHSGLGNIELAAKFRVLHQETSGWDVAVFPRVFLPAGSHLGDDHASLLLPVWVGRSWDDWSTFGGGGCAINRGGDSQDYCLVGWALTRKVSERLRLGGEVFHQSADTKGGDATTILGAGGVFDVNENLHWLGYVGAGVGHNDATDVTAYTSILFTF
ncbi:MAG: transporter [Pseudomonadota bacterium]